MKFPLGLSGSAAKACLWLLALALIGTLANARPRGPPFSSGNNYHSGQQSFEYVPLIEEGAKDGNKNEWYQYQTQQQSVASESPSQEVVNEPDSDDDEVLITPYTEEPWHKKVQSWFQDKWGKTKDFVNDRVG